jgi:hypothetical protein
MTPFLRPYKYNSASYQLVSTGVAPYDWMFELLGHYVQYSGSFSLDLKKSGAYYSDDPHSCWVAVHIAWDIRAQKWYTFNGKSYYGGGWFQPKGNSYYIVGYITGESDRMSYVQ